jgi:hypothetical protein
MPPSLREAVEALADREGRSILDYARKVLIEHVQAQPVRSNE